MAAACMSYAYISRQRPVGRNKGPREGGSRSRLCPKFGRPSHLGSVKQDSCLGGGSLECVYHYRPGNFGESQAETGRGSVCPNFGRRCRQGNNAASFPTKTSSAGGTSVPPAEREYQGKKGYFAGAVELAAGVVELAAGVAAAPGISGFAGAEGSSRGISMMVESLLVFTEVSML